MDDLISRQAAIQALDNAAENWNIAEPYHEGIRAGFRNSARLIMSLPSAQPESAQWVQMLINPNLYKCSNCQIAWNKRLVFENEGYSNNILMRYCPRCGRKMTTEVDYE